MQIILKGLIYGKEHNAFSYIQVSIKLNFSNTLQYKCLENGIVKSGFNAVYGRPRFEAKIGSRLLDLEEIWQV